MSSANEETRNSGKRASWLQLSWGARFAIAATGSMIAWWWRIDWTNGLHYRAVSTPGGLILLAIFAPLSILLPLWTLLLLTEVLSRSGKWGLILSSVLLLSFTAWIMSSLFKGWFGLQHGGSLIWIFMVALIAAVLLYPLPIMRMQRKAVRLTTLGDYEGALQISRRWLRSRVYGRAFQGWIMLVAGRDREALELLKGSAFDEKGRAQLKSVHLHSYALALMNEENYSEAQPLLEAAARVPQRIDGYFKFALAECLLSQNKEPDRALALTEQVIAKLKREPQSARDRIFMAQCMALHAWALACCQRREEAEAGLQARFVESSDIGKDDLAGLQNLKGMTWHALGDKEMARAAFEQALTHFPYGSVARFARRELATLDKCARN